MSLIVDNSNQLKLCFRRIALVEGLFGVKRSSYSGYAHSIRKSVPSDLQMLPIPDFESTQVISQGSRPTEKIPANRVEEEAPTQRDIALTLPPFVPVTWTH
jgi:hypothetical protein